MSNQPARRIYDLATFGQRNPSFPPTVMRNLLYKRYDRHTSNGPIKGNGLEVAVVRIGRRLYIDEGKFIDWLDSQQKKEHGNV